MLDQGDVKLIYVPSSTPGVHVRYLLTVGSYVIGHGKPGSDYSDFVNQVRQFLAAI